MVAGEYSFLLGSSSVHVPEDENVRIFFETPEPTLITAQGSVPKEFSHQQKIFFP